MHATYTRKQHLFGIALIMLAGLFWSMGGVVVRVMETENAWQILLYRSIFVSLVVLAIVTVRTDKSESLLSPFLKSVSVNIIAGLGMTTAFTGFILALVHTNIANAFFLLATQPFIIALLAWITLKEYVQKSTFLAAFVTLIGVAVMFHEGIALGSLKGNVYALISALGFAVFTVALRYGRDVDMWPAILFGGLFTVLFATLMLLGTDSGFVISTTDLFWCAVLGVTQVGFGMLAYIAGSRWVSGAELGLLAMTEVVLGPVWAWLIVDEIPDRGTLIGGVIILCALFGLGLYRIYSAPALNP